MCSCFCLLTALFRLGPPQISKKRKAEALKDPTFEGHSSDVIDLSESSDHDDAAAAAPAPRTVSATETLSPWFSKKSPKKQPSFSASTPASHGVAPKRFASGAGKGASPLDVVGSSRQSALILADKMRPNTLDDFVGHNDLVEEGALLRTLIENDTIPSLILWAPPGTGKTTLANIIAHQTKCRFVKLSAVTSGTKSVQLSTFPTRNYITNTHLLRYAPPTRRAEAKGSY